MQRSVRRLDAGAGVAVVLAALWIGVRTVVPSDEDLRRTAEAQIERRLGIQASIGSVRWRIVPAPRVVVRDVRLEQPQPLTIRTLSIHPDLWRSLWRWTPTVGHVAVDGAVVPTVALRVFRGRSVPAGKSQAAAVERVSFRDVTWIARTGVPLPLEGEVDFDPRWRPRRAEIRRSDFSPIGRLNLERQGTEDRWQARVALGTGTADGLLTLTTQRDGTMVLGGTLQPRGIEVQSATSAFNRRSPIRGKANGRTAVSARGRTVGDLGRSLRLQTEFEVAPATILRFDVDKAVRTLGIEHDGQTRLESVTGTMDLQNTAEGIVVHFVNLRARADSFTATGEVTVFMRRLGGRGQLDPKGVVPIPFTVSGTSRKPKFSVLEGILGGKEGPRPQPPGTPPTRPTVPVSPEPAR